MEPGKAVHAYAHAAKRGHALATHRMAHMSLTGLGTSTGPSCEAAAIAFRDVAQRGDWAHTLTLANRKYLAGDKYGQLTACLPVLVFVCSLLFYFICRFISQLLCVQYDGAAAVHRSRGHRHRASTGQPSSNLYLYVSRTLKCIFMVAPGERRFPVHSGEVSRLAASPPALFLPANHRCGGPLPVAG